MIGNLFRIQLQVFKALFGVKITHKALNIMQIKTNIDRRKNSFLKS